MPENVARYLDTLRGADLAYAYDWYRHATGKTQKARNGPRSYGVDLKVGDRIRDEIGRLIPRQEPWSIEDILRDAG